jgi:NTP pyrophosphatase (non-canonical NTP hydrolase)
VDVVLGFVGDVGDLAKLIQAAEGVRRIPQAEARLEHELADCLWSLLVLAGLYGVDLEQAFTKTMDELEEHLSQSAK